MDWLSGLEEESRGCREMRTDAWTDDVGYDGKGDPRPQ